MKTLKFEEVNGRLFIYEDYEYIFPWDKSRKVIIAKGSRTNFASIPWWARWLISPADKDLIKAAAIHDGLVKEFKKQSFVYRDNSPYLPSWGEACDILIKTAAHEGAKKWKQFIVKRAVMAHGEMEGKA